MTGWVVLVGCEPTCRGCLKKGHIWADCPDNVEKVLVGTRKTTVGLAEKASAKILAQARLIDAGYGVQYDSTRDQYEVDTDSKPMTFTRKVNHGGKRSPHYTYVLKRAYVETVAANKAKFTRRDGEAA